MSAWLAVLGAANMERGSAAELDPRPFKVRNLARPQTMPVDSQPSGLECGGLGANLHLAAVAQTGG
jgi:hypothetical protein